MATYHLIKIRTIESAFKKCGLQYVSDEYNTLYEDDKYEDNTISYYPAANAYVMSLGSLYLMYPTYPTKGAAATTDTMLRTSQRTYDAIVYQCADDGHEEWFRAFHELAAGHLPRSVCYFDLSATLINEQDVQVRDERVTMKTLLISHSANSKTKKIVLDPYIAFRLCNAQLNLSYLRKQLEATPNADVLLVLAYAQPTKLVGIRAMRLSTAMKNPSMQGVYACGKGYGALLQTHTETILRTTLAHRMSDFPLFTLNSIPSSKGFWKKMGFKESKMANIRDPTASRMTKDIFTIASSSSSSGPSRPARPSAPAGPSGPKAKRIRIKA
jgi:hypothetical protein